MTKKKCIIKKKLTQKQIERRLSKRTREILARIERLEKSRIITKETLDLEFTV